MSQGVLHSRKQNIVCEFGCAVLCVCLWGAARLQRAMHISSREHDAASYCCSSATHRIWGNQLCRTQVLCSSQTLQPVPRALLQLPLCTP